MGGWWIFICALLAGSHSMQRNTQAGIRISPKRHTLRPKCTAAFSPHSRSKWTPGRHLSTFRLPLFGQDSQLASSVTSDRPRGALSPGPLCPCENAPGIQHAMNVGRHALSSPWSTQKMEIELNGSLKKTAVPPNSSHGGTHSVH